MSNVHGESRPWPARPRPLPDELLTSWIVRLASAHDIKPHALTALTWPGTPIWNRDFDVSPDERVLDDLAVRTQLPPEVVRRTCFAEFDGVLYEARHQVGKNRWVLPAGMYNRNRKAYGLQYCPECLSEDPEPYFRRAWRLACITVCVRHDRALRDRCPKCDSPSCSSGARGVAGS